MTDNLILLCGMPRSGTTWIGKILDSHPETLYRHEPDSVAPGLQLPLLPDSADAGKYRARVGAFLAGLERFRAAKVSGSLPIFSKEYCSPIELWLFKASVFGAKAAGRLFGDLPILPVRPKMPYRLVWKSIESVGRLGVLARVMPQARVVLLLRHPCAYVASVFRGEALGKFSEGTPASDDYGMFELLMGTLEARRYDLDTAKLKKMAPEERLAWRWVLFNEKAIRELEGLSNAMVLRYEDVCANPVEATRRLLLFAGLSWNRQTEAFIEESTNAGGSDPRYYSIYRDPSKAMNKWRTTLSATQVNAVVNVVSRTRVGSLYEEGETGQPEGSRAAFVPQ